MTDQPTCGTGLAENSTLPATLGELLGAMARVLDVHRQALDKTDPNTLLEIDAYTTLVTDLGTVSERLSAVARRMAGATSRWAGTTCRSCRAGRPSRPSQNLSNASGRFFH